MNRVHLTFALDISFTFNYRLIHSFPVSSRCLWPYEEDKSDDVNETTKLQYKHVQCFVSKKTFVRIILFGLPTWLSSKESACQCKRHGFSPWVRKIPWRRKWQPTPVFLPGKSCGQRSLAGYSPVGITKSQIQLSNWTRIILFDPHNSPTRKVELLLLYPFNRQESK